MQLQAAVGEQLASAARAQRGCVAMRVAEIVNSHVIQPIAGGCEREVCDPAKMVIDWRVLRPTDFREEIT